MLLDYRYSESAIEPEEIEINEDTVYIRKDIVCEERTSDDGVYSMWTYQEAVLTFDEYDEYSKMTVAKNAKDISMLMTSQKTSDDNQLAIMEAIADLYDAISTLKEGMKS